MTDTEGWFAIDGWTLYIVNRYLPGAGAHIRHYAGRTGHLDRIYTDWPDQDGIYSQCACHPAPNPAARDYRRRTKHRNRRRR